MANKKILVLGGANGRFNLGDDAMFESLIEAINPRREYKIITDGLPGWNSKLVDEVLPFAFLSFKNVRLKWLTCYLRFYFIFFWLWFYKIFNLLPPDPILKIYIKKIEKVDLVIFAGMGAMTDKFGHYGIITRGVITRIARYFQKPVIISGNGVGPIRNPRLISVAKKYIKGVEKIFVRDKIYSKKELLAIGYPEERIVEAIDDAYFYQTSQSEADEAKKILQFLSFDRQKFVVVNLHDWNPKIKDELFKKTYQALKDNAADYQALLLPNYFSSRMDDREILADFQKYLEHQGLECKLLKEQITPGIAKEILKKADFSIATRYHIGVFSLSVGQPTVLIMLDSGYYIQKMIGILDWYGLEEFALDYRSPQLGNKIKKIAADNQALSKKIIQINKDFDMMGFQSAEYLKKLLNKISHGKN